MTPPAAALRLFLAGRPARANAQPSRAWSLVERAAAGAGRPARPSLARAVDVAAAEPGRPWRALAEAGLIPPSWLDDASRGFVGHHRVVGVLLPPRPGTDARLRQVESDPSTFNVFVSETSELLRPGDLVAKRGGHEAVYVRALADEPHPALAAALAADAANVPQVEELAREVAQALVPWGGRPADVVAWQAGWENERFAVRPDLLRRVGDSARGAVGRAGPNADLSDDFRAALSSLPRSPSPELRGVIFDHLAWVEAARRGRRVTHVARFPAAPASLPGARYADLPNPFQPLLELVALGYFTRSPRGSTQVVFVPPLPGPGAEGGGS